MGDIGVPVVADDVFPLASLSRDLQQALEWFAVVSEAAVIKKWAHPSLRQQKKREKPTLSLEWATASSGRVVRWIDKLTAFISQVQILTSGHKLGVAERVRLQAELAEISFLHREAGLTLMGRIKSLFI